MLMTGDAGPVISYVTFNNNTVNMPSIRLQQNWKSGVYHLTFISFTVKPTRICTVNFSRAWHMTGSTQGMSRC